MILLEDEECAGCLNIGKAACAACCVPNSRLQCGAGLSFATVYFLQDALCVRIALFGSLFQPDFGLTIVLHRSAPLEIHHAQAVLGGCETLFCRFAVPIQCLPSVLRHAFAFIVHHAQEILCVGVPLLRRFAAPVGGLAVILCHTHSFGVHKAQIELCVGVALRRRFSIPMNGLAIILFRFQTEMVHLSQPVLRLGMPLRRQFAQYGQRRRIIASVKRLHRAMEFLLGR